MPVVSIWSALNKPRPTLLFTLSIPNRIGVPCGLKLGAAAGENKYGSVFTIGTAFVNSQTILLLEISKDFTVDRMLHSISPASWMLEYIIFIPVKALKLDV